MKEKKPDKETRGISRKDFVKFVGTGAAVVAGTAMAKPAFAQTKPPAKWDLTTDVVIVGYGGAGAISAINAADSGAKVIILEKYPADTATEIRHAPSSRYAGGLCVCAKDAKEGSKALMALSFGTTPQDVCDAWGEGAARNMQYWNSLVLDNGEKYPEPTWDAAEFPEMPGGH
ncbi:MAG: FAD-binding protein, partial [Spirochaetota bacterium]